jgi:hypothetical protein
LADCLQFGDKRTIVIKSDDLRQALRLLPKGRSEKLLKELEYLRNELAHAQDIIASYWPRMVELLTEAERLLKVCEQL